jgi:putative dimethyl sulfoxide reductase chaperone
VVATLPALASSLPPAFDADEAAAGHHLLFGLNVFPYEALFRDQSGLLGGAVSEAVAASYRQAGYAPATAASSPDHAGYELGLLAFLCGAEADAVRDGLRATVERVQGLQRDFLGQHLLAWLPPLAVAIREQDGARSAYHPFYAALAELALALVDEHVTVLGGLPAHWALPPAPPLLASEKTGLKQIAAYLLAPGYSGLYLSRDAIGELARALDLPHGFGGRQQMMANLLRAAAQYGQMAPLVAQLRQVSGRWQGSYRSLAGTALAPYAAAWEERVALTRQLLAEIGRRASEVDG